MPRSGPGPVMGAPPLSTSPWSAAISPASRLMSVVLPLPEKPTMATNSPGSTRRLRFFRTSVRALPCPYDLLTLRSSSAAAAGTATSAGPAADGTVRAGCAACTIGLKVSWVFRARFMLQAPEGSAVRGQVLQQLHQAVEAEADDADGEHRHHDPAQRIGAAVLELVPDELAQAGVLRQHLCGDQHYPAHTQRQAHAGEDEGQGRRQHDLAH